MIEELDTGGTAAARSGVLLAAGCDIWELDGWDSQPSNLFDAQNDSLVLPDH
jgi:hypothetical protein